MEKVFETQRENGHIILLSSSEKTRIRSLKYSPLLSPLIGDLSSENFESVDVLEQNCSDIKGSSEGENCQSKLLEISNFKIAIKKVSLNNLIKVYTYNVVLISLAQKILTFHMPYSNSNWK